MDPDLERMIFQAFNGPANPDAKSPAVDPSGPAFPPSDTSTDQPKGTP
jgi:hypothetical protein